MAGPQQPILQRKALSHCVCMCVAGHIPRHNIISQYWHLQGVMGPYDSGLLGRVHTTALGMERDRNANRNRCEHGLRSLPDLLMNDRDRILYFVSFTLAIIIMYQWHQVHVGLV